MMILLDLKKYYQKVIPTEVEESIEFIMISRLRPGWDSARNDNFINYINNNMLLKHFRNKSTNFNIKLFVKYG